MALSGCNAVLAGHCTFSNWADAGPAGNTSNEATIAGILAHEMTQIQMLQGMADSEERIARSKERERQNQMLDRTGKVSDYLP